MFTMALLLWLNILVTISKASSKPNVLLMVIDDLGWTDISSHGAEYQTKNIDALISSGIELSNYYVHLVCSPTRSALMTGQYSFKNGLQNKQTIPPASTAHLPFQNPTLPELLRKVNYTNHMLGKWHLGYAAWNMTPTGRGFDSHFGYFNGAEDYYTHEIGEGYDFWNNQQVYFAANNTYSINLYYPNFESIIINYNKTNTGQPLFMYMAFQTVHSPIENPPQLYKECTDIPNTMRKAYCQKMVDLDNTINDMVNLYKKYNLWDDTLLMVTTDNGGMCDWSDNINPLFVSWGCNMPYRAGKATLFEGGVKGVGFINGGNNVIPSDVRGTKSNILSHVIDLLPTIIEGVLDETLPDNVPFDGKNMWPALIQKDESLFNRTTLYIDIEANGTSAGIIDSNWKYFQGKQTYTGYFPCNQSGVYDNSSETVTEWLFNLETDQYETTNLASSNPDLVAKYQGMIRAFIENDGYMPEQSYKRHQEGEASQHGGVWMPWLT